MTALVQIPNGKLPDPTPPVRAGFRIRSLQDLDHARITHRSVFTDGGYLSSPKPAAIVINFNASMVLRLIQRGLWVYNKPLKQKMEIVCIPPECGSSSD